MVVLFHLSDKRVEAQRGTCLRSRSVHDRTGTPTGSWRCKMHHVLSLHGGISKLFPGVEHPGTADRGLQAAEGLGPSSSYPLPQAHPQHWHRFLHPALHSFFPGFLPHQTSSSKPQHSAEGGIFFPLRSNNYMPYKKERGPVRLKP